MPNQRREDIFSYFTRIEKLSKTLVVRDPDEVGLKDVGIISQYAIRLKMLVSASLFNEYKPFANKLRTKKPSKWMKYTKEEILDELKTLHDNSQAMPTEGKAHSALTEERGRDRRPRDLPGPGGNRPRFSNSKPRDRSKSRGPDGCPSEVCWSFWET